MEKYHHVPNMFAVRELGRFCSHFCEIFNCMSKLGWCLATAATVPLFGETCEKRKGKKPHRWQWLTLRVHEDTDMYCMWQVGWLLAEKVILGLSSHTEIRGSSEVSSKWLWHAHSLPFLRFLVCFPHFIYCLDFHACPLLHCLPQQKQGSKFCTDVMVDHSEPVWNCWDVAPEEAGTAASRACSGEASGFTHCGMLVVHSQCEWETRIQPPRREAKRFGQRDLKEAGFHSSYCFFSCQTLQTLQF